MQNPFSKLLAVALLATAGVASAEIRLDGAWLRAVPPVAKTMAGYVTFHNHGEAPVTITGVEAEIAGHSMIHDTRVAEDGSRKMVHRHQLVVPAGDAVALSPGGTHLMLMKLDTVPQPGEQVTVCFQADAERVCAPFPVSLEAPASSQ